ncbi:protein-disulfide reductase DsbD domain-containing protein [Pedobacter frigiditerrae]|uniref:protein-disulfide reductase DsbD domain-containing protein n=1 Tax=Pedobacter frigiditerrae TaxID=2530452 RepID=UPI002930B434|nr:protein-disulfide reductase DsbD domain-containing protein [Pedobacter frigiditerrae]
MKRIILFAVLIFTFSGVNAQLEKPVSWSYLAKKTNKNEATLYLKARMQNRWHIYSLAVKGIHAKTGFNFSPSKDYTLTGKTMEPKPVSRYDKILKLNLTYFENEVVFTQRIKLNKTSTIVKGKVEFMACNDKQCLPSEEVSFSIPVK